MIMSENQNPPGRVTPPKTPRWVIIFVVVLVLLVALVVIVHLMGFRFDHGTGAILFNNLAKFIKPATLYL